MTDPSAEFEPPGGGAVRNTEECPTCGASASVSIRDLQKCQHCGATWVTGTGRQSRASALQAFNESRTVLVTEMASVLPTLIHDGHVPANSPVAKAFDQYLQAMADYYEPQA